MLLPTNPRHRLRNGLIATVTLALLPGAAAVSATGLASAPAGAAAATTDPFAAKLHAMYANPERDYRPSVRWWLAEGLNTDDTLRKNVAQIDDSGFGAAEILAMPENGAPNETYAWGSQEWNADSQLVVKEAVDRGLGFSLTSGTNWTTANLPDTYSWGGRKFDPDNKAASKELDYATVSITDGKPFSGTLPHSPTRAESADATDYQLQGVVAYKVTTPRTGMDGGSYAEGTGTGVLDLGSGVNLTGQVQASGSDYTLSWTPPTDDDYAVLVYWMHGTGETADPSVSKNYTINYIDAYGTQAMKDYWERNVLTPELVDLLRTSGKGEIYMDSLELESYGAGGTLWGYDFLQEFQDRRGYDLTPYLPFISAGSARVTMWKDAVKKWDWNPAATDDEKIAKVRNDFFQTQTEMYEENVLKPLSEWLHGYHMTLRAEPSYGTVFEISTPAKYIDGIETESFAQNAEPDLYRGIGGSANMYGRVFSSETGAVAGANYVNDMDYYTQLAYLQFASGVQRTVFHGYSAIEGSDADTQWPGHEGMLPIFSERFNSRQPESFTYGQWNQMLSRNQKVLRQGQPQRDIAVLRTDNGYINYGFESGYDIPHNYAMHDEAFYWKDLSLQQNGYTYDYFSPQILEDTDHVSWTGDALQPDGPAYQAVIVYQEQLELSAAKALLKVAKSGLPVVFVNNTTETVACTASIFGPGGGCDVDVEHGKAASVSRSLADSDDDLQAVVDQIKAQPHTRVINNQSNTLATLKSLGVEPRLGFEEPNNTVLTQTRLDAENDVMYAYAYNYKFEVGKKDPPTKVDLVFDGVGKPYSLDDWTGDVAPIGTYDVRDGKTHVSVTLGAGENAIIALNLADRGSQVHAVSTTADKALVTNSSISVQAHASGRYTTRLSDGTDVTTSVEVPEPLSLTSWDVTVEDWNTGEKATNTETKFGHTTTEAYYTTKKTPLTFPNQQLVPWKDLPATADQLSRIAGSSMSAVSGVGTYTTTFSVPRTWTASTGATLDLGTTGGSTAEVFVNGKPAPALDTRTLRVDISKLVRPGANTVKVVVGSTLTNRLKQRGFSGWFGAPETQEYGLLGPVTVQPYAQAVTSLSKPAPTKAATRIHKLGQAPAKVRAGKRFTLRLWVSSPAGGQPTGTVRVVRNGRQIGTSRVVSGIATVTGRLGKRTRPGKVNVAVRYSGDGRYQASQSAVRIVVAKARQR